LFIAKKKFNLSSQQLLSRKSKKYTIVAYCKVLAFLPKLNMGLCFHYHHESIKT